MSKPNVNIEEVLAIEDETQRQKSLSELARLFKINTAKARKEDGTLDEDELVVLIYDAQQNRIRAKSQTTAILAGGAIFFILMLVIIFIFVKVMGL